MKKTIILCALLSAFGTTAMAKSKKVCFGSSKSDDTKGLVMTAEIDRQSVKLTPVKGETYDGTYPTYGTTVAGRDGQTYLEYKGENSDYQDVIMIDEELLHKGTQGLLQIRARGEGFFNAVYICKDERLKK